MLTEICAASIQSALNAEKGGAQRIELCAELAVGGITPSYGMIKEVISRLSIPVFVLIRPRSGDFNYSENEFEIMKTDIEMCKELGCAGIVSGILKADSTVDVERTADLIELSRPLEFTFHRAFDRVVNPFETVNVLMKLGADRILTSGQENDAVKGLDLLIQLKNNIDDRLTILPGGGIRPDNVLLFKENGFTEIHASASSPVNKGKPEKILMNSAKFFDENIRYDSDLVKIRKIVEAVAGN